MPNLCRILLAILLATSTLEATGNGFAIRGGFIAPYRGLAFGVYDPWFYDPWFGCVGPYRCLSAGQLRSELERDRRLQALRERATPGSPYIYGSASTPWGIPGYLPPPTPEANIQPAYRGASRLRPEYEQPAQSIADPASETRQ